MRTSEFVANVQHIVYPTFTTMRAPVKGVVVQTEGKKGVTAYPLGEQIASTVQAHGVAWASAYYQKAGVPLQEFLLLARGAGVLQ